MDYIIDDCKYEVIIDRKRNKNTYIRVKKDLKIYVTTHYFTTNRQIVKLIDDNIFSIRNMIDKQKKIMKKNQMFFYLGNSYDIIEVPVIDNIDIDFNNKNIYIKDKKMLDNWYKKEIVRNFYDRFNYCFNRFNEDITIPQLKIRSMKTRWGVYNRKNHSITLNSHLIEYGVEIIDYVIIHELSHIIHFDHSKDFWLLVSKYCPEYKKIRKELKE